MMTRSRYSRPGELLGELAPLRSCVSAEGHGERQATFVAGTAAEIAASRSGVSARAAQTQAKREFVECVRLARKQLVSGGSGAAAQPAAASRLAALKTELVTLLRIQADGVIDDTEYQQRYHVLQQAHLRAAARGQLRSTTAAAPAKVVRVATLPREDIQTCMSAAIPTVQAMAQQRYPPLLLEDASPGTGGAPAPHKPPAATAAAAGRARSTAPPGLLSITTHLRRGHLELDALPRVPRLPPTPSRPGRVQMVAPLHALPQDLHWRQMRREQRCSLVEDAEVALPLDDPQMLLAVDERTLLVADTHTVWRVDLKRLREVRAELAEASRLKKMHFYVKAKDKFAKAYAMHPNDEALQLEISHCDKLLRALGNPTPNNKDYRVNAGNGSDV
jgi:hypothetical protein